jgi:hypothetical protein
VFHRCNRQNARASDTQRRILKAKRKEYEKRGDWVNRGHSRYFLGILSSGPLQPEGEGMVSEKQSTQKGDTE